MWLPIFQFLSCQNSSTPKQTETSLSKEDSAEDTVITDTHIEGTDTSSSIESPEITCSDDFIKAIEWFDTSSSFIEPAEGTFSFGQTHVTDEHDQRWAPSLITSRDTQLFFSPEVVLSEDTDMRVSAWKNGNLLGVLPMLSPQQKPQILEQQLTSVSLEIWRDNIWSAFLPWEWIEEDVLLRIGYIQNDIYYEKEHTLQKLSAPHTFQLTRTKMVLFGTGEEPTESLAASKLLYDYFAVFPTAEMLLVDSLPWYLPRIVIAGDNGPILVTSEEERLEKSIDSDRWSILKNQFTLRMNLANIGRGLIDLSLSDGDHSPYSFGTSIGMGWVRNQDGSMSDLNNAPYAAGWTGWSALWLEECGNVFIHEVGHSATLEHFTTGTADLWGIEDQYPNDGTHIESHPWGFDTLRKQFRSWYRVDDTGIVYTSGSDIQGKRDPMNGGEPSNSMTCFPQYIPYHALKIQQWLQQTPTFGVQNGATKIVQWNSENHQYEETMLPDGFDTPKEIGVPIMTIVGTLGNSESVNQIYPPIFTSYGNYFEHPSPEEFGHPEFEGSKHVLKIGFADNSSEFLMIQKGDVVDEQLYVFSINIPLEKTPTFVELYKSTLEYPNIDIANATLLHHETITIPTTKLPSVLRAGKGHLANGTLQLSQLCEPNINCEQRTVQNVWRNSNVLTFQDGSDENINVELCGEVDQFSEFEIPIVNEQGIDDVLIVHAQKKIQSGDLEWYGSITDATPWIERPNLEQGIVIWLPYEENKDIPDGHWNQKNNQSIGVYEDGLLMSEFEIDVELRKYESTLIDLTQTFEFESPPVSAENSSVYFLLQDNTIGPTSRIWWGDATPTLLHIPVIDEITNETTFLNVQVRKRSCDLGWGEWWNLNSGQVADSNCFHSMYFDVTETDNTHLISGHTYKSPDSEPIIFEARRWHEPNAEEILEIFRYQFLYRIP